MRFEERKYICLKETPNGRFIICGGQDGNTIGLYEIDQASGALILRQRIAAGGNPSWVETRRGNGQA